MPADLTVTLSGAPIPVYLGENTAIASARAAEAAASADQAAASEAVALAAAGPNYADTAAGLAATSEGDTFAVEVDGIVTVYRHDAGPTATDLRVLPTTAALASTASGKGAAMVGFKQAGPGAVARTAEDKLREFAVSITDFGAVDGGSIVAAVNAALTALGTTNPASLVIPKGSWVIGANVDWSANRNVTFIFEPGAVIDSGAFTVDLPEKVAMEPGARFSGTGAVTAVNTDATPPSPSPGAGYVQYGNRSLGGINSFKEATSAVSNLAWGDNALASVTAGCGNIAIGPDALSSLTGNDTVADGTSGRHGWYNIAIGLSAGRDTLLGYENLYIGNYTGQQCVAGRWNVAIGNHSQILNQNGECNISIGDYALVSYGSNNGLAIGWAAAENHATGSIFAIGHNSCGGSVTSERCSGIGHLTLLRNQSGDDNTAVGSEALTNLVSGDNNTAVGSASLGALGGAGTNNTALGTNSLINLVSGDGNIAVGSGAGNTTPTGTNNSISIGTGASATKSNQTVIGNNSTTETKLRGVTVNDVYTVASLPSPASVGPGGRAFVSDASIADWDTAFGSEVAGGSSNFAPVYCTGTHWRIG